MKFSRQEYWNELPCPPPGDLPNPGIEPESPALAGGFFTYGTTYQKGPPQLVHNIRQTNHVACPLVPIPSLVLKSVCSQAGCRLQGFSCPPPFLACPPGRVQASSKARPQPFPPLDLSTVFTLSTLLTTDAVGFLFTCILQQFSNSLDTSWGSNNSILTLSGATDSTHWGSTRLPLLQLQTPVVSVEYPECPNFYPTW